MASAVISFNAIMPMFLMVMLGSVIKKQGLLPQNTLECLNKMNYYYIFPALTFQSAYTGDFSRMISVDVVIFCIAGVLLEYGIGVCAARFIDRDPSRRTVLVQSCFRTNMLLIGLPLAKNFFDDVSIVVIACAVIVPIYNLLSTVVCVQERKNIKKLVSGILKNPIVASTLLGIVLNLAEIKLPVFLAGTVSVLSVMGSNLALIILGGYFDFQNVRLRMKLLSKLSILRLVALPGIFLLLGTALGFRGIGIMTVLTVFGCPLPTIMFTLTKEMGGDAGLAGEAIVFTTLVSFFTLLIWISLLRSACLL